MVSKPIDRSLYSSASSSETDNNSETVSHSSVSFSLDVKVSAIQYDDIHLWNRGENHAK